MRNEDCVPKRKEKGIQKVKFLGVKKKIINIMITKQKNSM